jgi:hypothetical protein
MSEGERDELRGAARGPGPRREDLGRHERRAERGEHAGITVNTITSSVVADGTGFNSAYAELQTFVANLLAEGSTTTGAMASTLRNVRKQYEADDAAAMTRIGAEWAPVE